MKQLNITIHPFSALIGAALVCLTMLTVGAIAVQGSSSTRDVSAIENVNEPHPRDYVRIEFSTPYTVPAGKLFHLTGLGDLSVTSQWINFRVDAQIATRAIFQNSLSTNGILATTPGVVAASGSVLSVSGANVPVALGYLVDA